MSANFNVNANIDVGGNWEDHHEADVNANMGYGASAGMDMGYGASGGMDMGYGASGGINMGYGASGGMDMGYGASGGMDMGYGASGGMDMGYGVNVNENMGYGASGSLGVNAGCGGKANVQINSGGGCGGAGVGCGGSAKVQINSGGGCGGIGVNSMGGAKVNVGLNSNTNYNAGVSGGVYIEQHPAPVTIVTPGKTVFSISGNTHSVGLHSAALDPLEKNTLASQTECGVMINIIDPSQAIIVLILNIIWPGIGTMVYGCMGRASSRCCCWFLLGLCQDFLGYICIGWIWGIIFALKVMAASALYDEIDLYQPLEPVAVVQMGSGFDGHANLTVKVQS
jgi:hypothetical protein